MAISQHEARDLAEEELAFVEQRNLLITPFNSQDYPADLRELHDPPILLFSNGPYLEKHRAAVAIVGSRKCSEYGAQATRKLAGDCARAGITVVSGLAWGIDQLAHRAALEAGGETIAILGTGFRHIYPAGTEKLVEEISHSGLVATEFTQSNKGAAWTFPARNRIVAGISPITIVIEAAERSGALITARLANETGKNVMAVPGSIFSNASQGTNALIQQGAKLVRSIDDILEELPEHLLQMLTGYREMEQEPINLSPEEQQVLNLLSVDRPEHIDIIAHQLQREPAQLSATLLQLEINGIVRQLPGMKFVKTI